MRPQVLWRNLIFIFIYLREAISLIRDMYTTIAIKKVKEFSETHHFDKSHDFSHIMAVLAHIQRMVLYHKSPPLSMNQLEDLNLAVIFHEVDDRKFFPEHHGYQNARRLLGEVFELEGRIACIEDTWFRIEQIIYIISLVSTSSNGNMLVSAENLWMLYPRFADRLEAMGKVGIERCRLYSIHINRPLSVPETLRCTTEAELWSVAATPERFQRYLKVKESVSMIDHIYDKLLHIGKPDLLGLLDNDYLTNEVTIRHQYMIDYVLEFGRTGIIPRDI